MSRKYIFLIGIFLIFLASSAVPLTLGYVLIIFSAISLLSVTVWDWIRMIKIEKDILIKFNLTNKRKLGLTDFGFAIGVTLVAAFGLFLFVELSDIISIPVASETIQLNDWVLPTGACCIIIINAIFQQRYKDGYLTSQGIFYTKNGKEIKLDQYDDYHYEVKHNSFILSKDGVETIELIPKTPIETHADVLIDLFDNGIEYKV